MSKLPGYGNKQEEIDKVEWERRSIAVYEMSTERPLLKLDGRSKVGGLGGFIEPRA